jgi:hypothetical protein
LINLEFGRVEMMEKEVTQDAKIREMQKYV